MKRFGLVLLVLFLLPFSVLLNAWSAIVWSTDGKPNDVGDDGVLDRSWEGGMANCFGLIGPAVMKILADLKSQPFSRHHIKGILHVWIREYPKRASKVSSLGLLILIAALIWRPWA